MNLSVRKGKGWEVREREINSQNNLYEIKISIME